MQSENSSTKIKSSITIDVEDGISILMRDYFNILMPPTERVVTNVEILLYLFDKHATKATFFILGEVAENYPELIKKINAEGHEIGVHGYRHDQLFNQTPERGATDISRAKKLIEDIISKPVYGFRAPAFSISHSTSWVFEVLAEAGFLYDSSIMPVTMQRYGWELFGKDMVRIDLPSGNSIIEVPLPVISLIGRNVPSCGGGYLRYLPYTFTRIAFSRIIKKRPVIVYLHPYEIDNEPYPDFFYNARKSAPVSKKLPMMLYRLGKSSVPGKLDRLLRDYHFIPLIEIIKDYENHNAVSEKYFDPRHGF